MVELARVEDAADILELQKLAYQSEARLYDDWTLPPLIQTLESLRQEFTTKVVLKAMEAGRLIGSVRAHMSDDACQIARLIVHPELQGRGVGTALMRHIESRFSNASVFELFTGSRSEGNLRFYEKLGFRKVREQTLTTAVTLVFMEKRP
jgi:ribosomal protein S18 acetylase RimI-like enzyme